MESPQAIVPGPVRVCAPDTQEILLCCLQSPEVKVTRREWLLTKKAVPEEINQQRAWERTQLIPIATKPDCEKLPDLLINSVAVLLILTEHNFQLIPRAAFCRVINFWCEADLSVGLSLAQDL